MKIASPWPGSVSISDPACGSDLRRIFEASPTVAGLPGQPWQAPLRTVDRWLARPRPSPCQRQAHDPLGRGWTTGRSVLVVLRAEEVAPAEEPKLVAPRPSRVKPAPPRPGRAAGGKAGVAGPVVPVVAASAASNGGVPFPAETVPAPWSDPVSARVATRRIELIPAAPPLPAILFTGDAPPPGFAERGGQVEELVRTHDEPDVGAADFPANAGPVVGEAAWGGGAMEEVEHAGVGVGGDGGQEGAPREPSGQVWLTARDPFTVVAHWDREPAPAPGPAGPSAGVVAGVPDPDWGRGRWWMRLHAGSVDGPVVTERPASEVAGTVLLPVVESGKAYVAELGYDAHRTGWHGVAISHPVPTPPDRPSVPAVSPSRVEWGTVAPWEGEPGGGRSVGYVPTVDPGSGLVGDGGGGWVPMEVEETWHEEEAVGQAEEAGPLAWSWKAWLGQGESSAVLADSSGLGAIEPARRRVLTRRERLAGTGSGLGTELADLDSSAVVALPVAEGRGRSFWFRVNAEVILHGSTEPDARVTIAGRPVRLRPDGSFSFRFAFPDGDYELPVSAVSADGEEGRSAHVRFQRGTRLEGEVGEHPVVPAWDADLQELGGRGG